MHYLRCLFNAFVLLISCTTVISQRCEIVVPLGMEDPVNGIVDSSITASSYYSKDYGPWNARLFQSRGAGSWQAAVMNNQQYLQIKLGGRRVITQISTQGRRGAKEIVTQYFVDFSDDPDAKNWLRYLDDYGQPNYFMATGEDDNFVSDNFLTYPIVAQYVRIIPQRWIRLISMRVEVYGCDYDKFHWSATFDGQSRLEYQMDQPGMQAEFRNDMLQFRFRSKKQNGLLFYASSTLGDYLAVELWRAQLRININLGPSDTMPGDNSLLAGSLLDDGHWHDVRIVRNALMINVSVDRAMVWTDVLGQFYNLDVNQNITVGGLRSYSGVRGVSVTSNFTGCIENLYFNELNMFRDFSGQAASLASNDTTGFYTGSLARYAYYGVANLDCTISESTLEYPITFQTGQDFISYDYKESTELFVQFEFRTFQKLGSMIWAQLAGGQGYVYVQINADGLIQYDVVTSMTNNNPMSDQIYNLDPQSPVKHFADGLWHTFYMRLSKNTANVTIDSFIRITTQTLDIQASKTYYLGGNRPGYTSFMGCMRNIIIGGNVIDPTSYADSMTVGTCLVRDRCLPNPCEHNGICSQTWTGFTCDCSGTGYTGGVCHISAFPTSCTEVRMYNLLTESVDQYIDVDGSGPLPPIWVNCYFPRQYNDTRTIVHHDAENLTLVDGYEEPGSYSKTLVYALGTANLYSLQQIALRGGYCRQYMKYKCQQARLLLTPAQVGCQTYQPNCWQKSYGWWIGRTGMPLNYWGGAAPGTGKCSCGARNGCQGANQLNQVAIPCNCDAPWSTTDNTVWLVDDGYLDYKSDLPVLQVRFGDTGSMTDGKKAQYQVGPLECFGDNFFDNVVTFRRKDANIEFPPVTGGTFDIKFQFRTTNMRGVFFQAIGPDDFIMLYFYEGNKVQFRFSAGYGLQVLEKFTGIMLSDNRWHTVLVERNRKQAFLQVDNQAPVTLDMMPDMQYRPFFLTSNLSIGCSVTFDDGFAGCIRAFTLNGVLLDLAAKVRNNEYTYGLSLGCVEKCVPNPCLNSGECYEYYDTYYCECGRTSTRGYICGREVGVNMQPELMIKYIFDDTGNNIGSVDEYIKVSFATVKKQGILLQVINPDLAGGPDYMTIFVNNNGGITMEFDVGWGRFDASCDIEKVDIANNQNHDVYIQVDDFEPCHQNYDWVLNDQSDTRLDSPKYLYIGRNETTPTGQGFQGCVYNMQYNNIFPIRIAFNDPPLSNVLLVPNMASFIQDKCGTEELLPPPPVSEVRPMPPIPSDVSLLHRLPPDLGVASTAIIVGVVIGVIVIIVIAVFLLCRYFQIDTGVYETGEAKGTEMADTPDTALRLAADESGQPDVESKQEVFM